jgi:mannose-1-phosphate guanylyltransferase
MTEPTHPTFALILAGGAGTRFWPASRSSRPKQLLPLIGADPLILETARRVLPLCAGSDEEVASGQPHPGWARVLIASGKHLAEPTAAILRELPFENLLVEPVPRNTAPCIGWAAAHVARHDPEAVVIVLPSDHHIVDVVSFRATLDRAVASARPGRSPPSASGPRTRRRATATSRSPRSAAAMEGGAMVR